MEAQSIEVQRGVLVGSLRRSEPELEEVDRLIEKRAAQRQDQDEREESWKASVRAYHARRRDALRWEWIRYFELLARNHAAISKEYAGRAESLMETE